jgi:peroxiredoxin
MEMFFLPNEAVLLTFKHTNGSGWLTNYRLILCEHDPGHLEGHTPEIYALKDFKKAQVKCSTLTLQFKGKKQVSIALPDGSTALLREVKKYIEEAAKHRSK